ncbi:MAG TPA: hypothetical protein VHB72_00765 [Candidatus Saccharimonadales bacterium]|nr:hypothetical protein [Candidatus Saccharimonadales bacterium]
MLQKNEKGAVSGVLVSLICTAFLLVLVIVFAAWAFSSRQDYKNHTDAKINAAVTVAKQQESSLKDTQFAEEEKNPLKAYTGPEAYGSIVLNYPKTWSSYVSDSSSGGSAGANGAVIDGYFYPGVVPSITSQSSVFALRLQVLSQPYSQVTQNLTSLTQSNNPPVIVPYALPKVPNITGVKITGSLPGQVNKTGQMVILPLRSQTLELWTEGNQFTSDFNNIILPNLSFSP